MGILDGLLGGSGYMSPGISELHAQPQVPYWAVGLHAQHAQYAREVQQAQQQGLSALLGDMSSSYGHLGSPFDLQSQAYRLWQENRRQAMQQSTHKKHVDSRDVTPRERARKQINGAVQAVKDAQLVAKGK